MREVAFVGIELARVDALQQIDRDVVGERALVIDIYRREPIRSGV